MHQALKFLITGVVCTGSDYVVYNILLHLTVLVDVSKATGAIVGIILNYIINSKWTFLEKPSLRTMVKFMIIYGINIVLNVSVNSMALSALSTTPYRILGAFVCAAICSAVFSYLCLKLWVFRKKEEMA